MHHALRPQSVRASGLTFKKRHLRQMRVVGVVFGVGVIALDVENVFEHFAPILSIYPFITHPFIIHPFIHSCYCCPFTAIVFAIDGEIEMEMEQEQKRNERKTSNENENANAETKTKTRTNATANNANNADKTNANVSNAMNTRMAFVMHYISWRASAHGPASTASKRAQAQQRNDEGHGRGHAVQNFMRELAFRQQQQQRGDGGHGHGHGI